MLLPLAYIGILDPSGLCKVSWGTLLRAMPSITSLLLSHKTEVRTYLFILPVISHLLSNLSLLYK